MKKDYISNPRNQYLNSLLNTESSFTVPATLQKNLDTGVALKFCEIFKNCIFKEYIRTTASTDISHPRVFEEVSFNQTLTQR